MRNTLMVFWTWGLHPKVVERKVTNKPVRSGRFDLLLFYYLPSLTLSVPIVYESCDGPALAFATLLPSPLIQGTKQGFLE